MFAGGYLGSETDTIEVTASGGLDINRVAIAALNTIEPTTIVPSLPFLFRSKAHMRKALDGPAGDIILESLKPHGLIGLCFYDSGERCFYNTKKPILTPEDMKGMRIRVQNSDLYVSMVKALGADAAPMPLGEVYQSLVRGVIDGAENNWPSYQGGRHFEGAPYYSLTRHAMAPEVLVMSSSRWNKLSKTDQDITKQAAKDSVPFMRDLWDKRVNEARITVLRLGVKTNEVNDLSAFGEKVRPVWDRFLVTEQQKALVNSIRNI
jgi:tripartite ATP-independent transporter DctP family solute receptor